MSNARVKFQIFRFIRFLERKQIFGFRVIKQSVEEKRVTSMKYIRPRYLYWFLIDFLLSLVLYYLFVYLFIYFEGLV